MPDGESVEGLLDATSLAVVMAKRGTFASSNAPESRHQLLLPVRDRLQDLVLGGEEVSGHHALPLDLDSPRGLPLLRGAQAAVLEQLVGALRDLDVT